MLIRNIALAILVILPSAAAADVVAEDQLFKDLCVGDKSAGFSWEHNEWVYARFKPDKYIVEKIKIEKPTAMAPNSAFCWSDPMANQQSEFSKIGLAYGCYNIRELGKPITPAGSHLCLEQWTKKGDKATLDLVYCKDDIQFQPDGNFHMVEWTSAGLNSKASYNDSMVITVGKCSEIP